MADEGCTDCQDEATLPTSGTDPRGTKVIKWGPTLLAPIGKPTGDRRRFAAGALSNRDLPLPLKWQRADGQGHGGSVVIGTIDGVVYDADGAPHGFGLLFDPDPEQLPRLAEDAGEARTLWQSGAVGPSVDLDDMEFHQIDPTDGQYAADGQRPEIEVTRGRISAVTLVQIPAFAEAGGPVTLTEMDPTEYQAELSAYRSSLTAAVAQDGWDALPIAPDGTPFEPAAARARVEAWAAGDQDRYAQAFLWRDPNGTGELSAYRFPLADVVDGKLSVVPAAVQTARAVLAGERGETVVPQHDREAMLDVLAGLDPDAALAEVVASLDDAEFAQMEQMVGDVEEELATVGDFGARFEKLKAHLAAKGIKNPGALAAKIGRDKYGKKGMAKLREGVAAKKVKPLHGHVTASTRVQEAMVAAAALNDAAPGPLPGEWFADPKLSGPTPLTVTPEGRVYGHLAKWGTCHTGFPGTCVTPPKSKSKYAYFHTGAVDTTVGTLPVGRVSIGGGHADTRRGFQAAIEHYDSTSTQAAVVRAGEDKFGIWVAGSLVPGADRDALMRSPLSGDWRYVGGGLELVHALAVNSPGFPIPRGNLTAAGVQTALVAAGVLATDEPGGQPAPIDVRALVVETITRYREAEAAFARKAKAASMLAQMDEDGDEDEQVKRRLRTKKAVRDLAMAAPPSNGG